MIIKNGDEELDKFRIFKDTPYLEVIAGGMYSGKSQEINRRLTNIDYYNQHRESEFDGSDKIRYIILKPNTDTRSADIRKIPYVDKNLVVVSKSDINHDVNGDYISLVKDYDYIILDEAQFFDSKIISTIKLLLEENKYVLVAGLDKDHKGEPFSDFMKWVLAVADEVTKLTAICANCGSPSTMAKLVSKNPNEKFTGNIIIEDENHRYVPLCRKCMNDRNLFKKI